METIIAEQSAGFHPQPHRVAINDAGMVAFARRRRPAYRPATVSLSVTGLTFTRCCMRVTFYSRDSVQCSTFAISNDAINDVGQVAILVTYDDGTGVAKYAIVRANPSNRAPVAADGER